MKEYIIGKIDFYSNMPIATIVDKETLETVGYLGPFRGYCFQVSATFDGRRRLGSSTVIGLGNIWLMDQPYAKVFNSSNVGWTETKLEMLKGQAMIAISDFVSRNGAIFHNKSNNDYAYSDGNDYWGYTFLDKFINEVGIYLDKNLDTNFMISMKR